MKVEWSDQALADRRKAFESQESTASHEEVVPRTVRRISGREVSIACDDSRKRDYFQGADADRAPAAWARPIRGREEYRQIVLQVLHAAYVFQYRIDGERLVMLRVFHGREARD
jgi:plasmid stabilization system protein ParE